MESLKAIRQRIGSVRNTQQITRAMKMVAAARLRKAQEAIETMRPYSYRLLDIISQLAARAEFTDHPLLAQREPRRIRLLIMTSDRGLCGGFNANINRRAERYIQGNEGDHEEILLDIIGRKGQEYFRRRDVNLGRYFEGILEKVDLNAASDVGEKAMADFIDEQLDAVYVVYNEFKSAITQRVVVEQLLPVVPLQTEEREGLTDFIYEPSKQAVLEAALPRHINVQIYRMLLESVASEMGARMSAMDNATRNAGEIIDDLTMQYNRARQAQITKELMEIIGGAEALS